WKKTSVRGTTAGQSLAPDVTFKNFFTHVSYQLTDSIEVFAEVSLNRSETYNYGYTTECNSCLTIDADNPFIPESVAAQMQALGLTEFVMGTQNMDLGTIATDPIHDVQQFMVGADGMFDAFGSSW